ncbi:MAG: heparinase [Gammaproteobacteria bacterium]|nr:MAG: heparinase [Gammaproteobacteria bacterium]RLA59595.1 MAG: heparinase [Gammaproteobacteria bacterium]
MSLSRLFHTVKYLKLRQVLNRLVRRLRKPGRYQGGALAVIAPDVPWQVHAALPSSFTADSSVTFLNEPGALFEWEDPGKSKLWLYNLHYFDDLVAENASFRTDLQREVIARWMVDNPPLTGTGWEPYPLSLRIGNWIKWLLVGNEPVEGMQISLLEQAYALSQQVEYHLLGNHILANAKALVFAGTYFEGDIADAWLHTGIVLLKEQLTEQVLADGAHFELSPMYHSIILTDLLDLIQLGQLYPGSKIAQQAERLRNTAALMASWLEGMLHPDGGISFFNDTAFGIAPEPAAILTYAEKLGVKHHVVPEKAGQAQHDTAQHFHDSGYIAVRQHDQVALLDVAAIGPDYIPGHAHADTLSFEWSLKGQRVLVNSGTSEYGLGAERLRQRGTAAHNTVMVNEENSSEVWSGFRVARRARVFDVAVEQKSDTTIVKAAHDSYKRLRPKVIHQREWRLSPGVLEVSDTLTGKFRTAKAYFHLHPFVKASLARGVVDLTPELIKIDVDLRLRLWHFNCIQ